MKSVRIGLASLNQTPLDWAANRFRIESAIKDAARLGIEILCLPELCVSGYGCEDYFYHKHVAKRSLAITQEIASCQPEMVVLMGLPLFIDEVCYNALAVTFGGEIQGMILKTHLARDGIHYEPRWFTGWNPQRQTEIEINGRKVPCGSFLFEWDGLLFGSEICEDAWVRDEIRPCLGLKGAHLVFNASASHFSLGKESIRDDIVARSSSFGFVYAYANLVGNESGRAIYDGGLLIAKEGQMVAQSDSLGLKPVDVLAYDLEYSPRYGRLAITLNRPARSRPPAMAQQVMPDKSYDQAFVEAATLALWDYLRKSGTTGFVLSLSGGVDSSACAVLVWCMAHRVLKDLNDRERRQAWPQFPHWNEVQDVPSFVRHLLSSAYQSTRNSGPVTRNAAQKLAEAVGATHLVWDVDAMVEQYKAVIGEALDLKLNWDQHDIALQNIQARVRAPGIWMVANLQNKLLLTTSNRSEAAVGYATMDGDTSGSIAPIAGIQKTYLRRWLKKMENGQVEGFPELPELRFVNEQEPTAELRPPHDHQSDEDDLMPYFVLDILEKLLTSGHDPNSASLELEKSGLAEKETCKRWTQRFFRMFAHSQWKRERIAPSFHLDDQSLDPKTWARFPILSGAFQVECEDLGG